jgi:hypothetical protein
MDDKQNAARVAWATIKLSQVGQRPVGLDQLATHVGLPVAETAAEATCPATGTSITVDITPEGVERIDPPTAVVAVVNLDADLTLGPDRIDADVRAQQPFFASAQAASRWLADHPHGRLIAVRSFCAEARRLVDRLEAASPATQVT